MTKADLVKSIAKKAGLTNAQATAALDATTEVIVETLNSGEEVTLKGFGVFKVQHRPARTGRNPATGAAVAVPAKNLAKFKFSKEVALD